MDRLGGAFGSFAAQDHEYDFDDPQADDAPPSPVGQDERRMQVRAYNHWASLLGDGNLPSIEDLEPDSLPDFGPYSVLLDFSSGIDNPAVRYIGAELRQECDAQGVIDRLSDVPPRSLLSRITDHYMQILANQAPIGFEAEYLNQRDATVLYRGILLPYSSDDETIDFIFGVINWKEMADSQTADELLLEIDQALTQADGESFADDDIAFDLSLLETARSLDPATPESEDDEIDDVFDLDEPAGPDHLAAAPDDLPFPAFGGAARVAAQVTMPAFTRRERGYDALGNPLGAAFEAEVSEEDRAGGDEGDSYGAEDDLDDGFDSAMKTAADYGLPEWDDEDESEDVEDLIDPLAEDHSESSLMSLVSRGAKAKKAVDLGTPPAFDAPPAVPTEYEPPVAAEPIGFAGFGYAPPPSSPPAPAAPDITPADEPCDDLTFEAAPEDEPAGLYDCLAQARALALAAQSTEDRSRKALYAAVGRAYDFSLEATANPADFNRLMADNGLTMQDRAPMTPVVKLVFGSDYDKTRLTEYAAVLTHAHRVGVQRGRLVAFLAEAEGGLKGIVQAERRARREEQGKPLEDTGAYLREGLAAKLRAMPHHPLESIAPDGPEFALVMVRRMPGGGVALVSELDADRALLEQAAKKLLAA
ncbi:hypothetical protein [Qipengyuania sp.]|uniref:PAS domain-containing protein n=1 Tax=Qipengyuania sp. TaxID=2004515 RepID=UPI003735BB14